MSRGRSPAVLFTGICLAICFLCSSTTVQAEPVTKYFSFSGAKELWNWTTTGKTKLGTDVTAGTTPAEMADPARLSWYGTNGTLLWVYRNYRPEEFQNLTAWKTATSSALFRFHLAGEASGTGEMPLWGETLTVTAIGQPAHEPDYDEIPGMNWFAQTGFLPDLTADAPYWWCEADSDGILKTNDGFRDMVQYTFDDSAILPDGRVQLWIRGLVTESLAGMEAGTAEYGVLEGGMSLAALDDQDGDGYFSFMGGTGTDATDCDDNPAEDPAICQICTCGNANCAACAACIHPGAVEFPNDGIDSNCSGDGGSWGAQVSSTVASAYGSRSLAASGMFNGLFIIIIPVGAGIFLRIFRKKK